jgi:hypothetical protein
MHNPYYATAADFTKWTAQAKTMTVEALQYSIKDCREAADAMATHTAPNKEDYYRDQGMTFSDELRKRQK